MVFHHRQGMRRSRRLLEQLARWRHLLPRRRHHPHHLVSQMTVAQVMTTHILTVPTTMELAELAWVFEHGGSRAVLVIDPHGAFHGLLSLADLKRVLMGEAAGHPTAGDLAVTTIAHIYPDDLVAVIVACMASSEVWCLPVVDRSRPPQLLGVVYREDLHRACHVEGKGTDCPVENH